MAKALMKLLSGDIIDEYSELSFAELCRVSQLTADQVIELVEHGVLEPVGERTAHWRFSGVCLKRVRSATRLQRDLGINTVGVALVLELLDELYDLRQKLDRLEHEPVNNSV